MGLFFATFLTILSNNSLLSFFVSKQVLQAAVQNQTVKEFPKTTCITEPNRFRALICPIGAENVRPSFALWGDSHAKALATGMSKIMKNQNKQVQVLTRHGCAPLLRDRGEDIEECKAFNQYIAFDYLARADSPKTVVVVSRWKNYLRAALRDADTTAPSVIPDGLYGLERSLQQLGRLGKKVVLVTQAPEIANLKKLLACKKSYLKNLAGSATSCQFDTEDKINQQIQDDLLLRMIAAKYDFVRLIDTKSIFCDKGGCKIADENDFFFRDRNHLNPVGASKIVKEHFLGM